MTSRASIAACASAPLQRERLPDDPCARCARQLHQAGCETAARCGTSTILPADPAPVTRAVRELGTMLDQGEFDRWRQSAEEALRSARVQTEAGLHQWACFLAEQSAQLALKGLLHGFGADAWGHDLVRLGEAVGEAVDAALPDDVQAALRQLSRHYIPARYPDAHPSGTPGAHYGPQDASIAIRDAEAVAGFVALCWQRLAEAAAEDQP
jgi:HEPN domain-containing protein